jgi:hypothetical protein
MVAAGQLSRRGCRGFEASQEPCGSFSLAGHPRTGRLRIVQVRACGPKLSAVTCAKLIQASIGPAHWVTRKAITRRPFTQLFRHVGDVEDARGDYGRRDEHDRADPREGLV